MSPWSKGPSPLYTQTLQALARHYDFSMDKPWRDLPEQARQVILHGSGGEKIRFIYDDNARKYEVNKTFEGVLPNLERRWRETDSAWVREELGRYQSEIPCEACEGFRLKPEAPAMPLIPNRKPTLAWRLKARLGLKTRFSIRCDSIFVAMTGADGVVSTAAFAGDTDEA